MKTRATSILIALLALFLAGCASAPSREGEGTAGGEQTAAGVEGTTVLQWIDITNQTKEPVVVTARVGAGPEQPLGFFGPAEYRRVKVSTGAATTDEIFLEAGNNTTGNQATAKLPVTPGQTLRWDIQF